MNDVSIDVPEEAIVARIAARYRLRRHRSYVRSKLRWDPLFAGVAPLFVGSSRPLLDIGCGLGLLGQYLRERGFRAPYLGLDLDERKIEEARLAASGDGLDLEFAAGSAASLPGFLGDVALLDVLHYMPAEAQQRTLVEVASRVAPDGILVIRNVLKDGSWRFAATVAQERFSGALGWMRFPACHFPEREEIESPLRAMGFATHVVPLWGRTPFNSYLFVARREPGA
jgi:2-polyprenyl-3-methyl-5-hydroxy-6-metoxy-1,4-benzoquinol methylase